MRWPDDIEYFRVMVEDTMKAELRPYFNEVIGFIKKHVENGKGVLVRCAAGVSRSASMVAAYLMQTRKWTLANTLKYMKDARPIVAPNPNFIKQLKTFESDLDIRP